MKLELEIELKSTGDGALEAIAGGMRQADAAVREMDATAAGASRTTAASYLNIANAAKNASAAAVAAATRQSGSLKDLELSAKISSAQILSAFERTSAGIDSVANAVASKVQSMGATARNAGALAAAAVAGASLQSVNRATGALSGSIGPMFAGGGVVMNDVAAAIDQMSKKAGGLAAARMALQGIADATKNVGQAATTTVEPTSRFGAALGGISSWFRNLRQTAREAADGISSNGDASENATSRIRSLVGQILTLAAAYKALHLVMSVIKEGVEFNSEIEQSKLGIASLIATFGNLRDEQGRLITGTDKYTESLKIAADMQEEMKTRALTTTLQYSELLRVLQDGFAPAVQAGFSSHQIVEFTAAMAQAGKISGLEVNEIGTNIRALLEGIANPRYARLAYQLLTSIGGTPAERRATIAHLRETGQLYDFLMGKLSAFALAGQQAAGTFAGALSNLKDIKQQLEAVATEELTKSLAANILEASGALVRFGADGKAVFNPEFVRSIRDVADAIGYLAGKATTAFTALPSLIEQVRTWWDIVKRGDPDTTVTQELQKQIDARSGATRIRGADFIRRQGVNFSVSGRGFPLGIDSLYTVVGEAVQGMTEKQLKALADNLNKAVHMAPMMAGNVSLGGSVRTLDQLDVLKAIKAAREVEKVSTDHALGGKHQPADTTKEQLKQNSLDKSLADQLDQLDKIIRGREKETDLARVTAQIDAERMNPVVNGIRLAALEREKMRVQDVAKEEQAAQQIDELERHHDELVRDARLKGLQVDESKEIAFGLQIAKARQQLDRQASADRQKEINDEGLATIEVYKKTFEEILSNRRSGSQSLLDIINQEHDREVQLERDKWESLWQTIESDGKRTLANIFTGHGSLKDGLSALFKDVMGGVADDLVKQLSAFFNDMRQNAQAVEKDGQFIRPDGQVITAGSKQQAQMQLGGVEAGIGALGIVAGARGNTRQQNLLGGVTSGAAIGAQIGSYVGQPIIGAVLGAVVGGLLGAIVPSKSEKSFSIHQGSNGIYVTGAGDTHGHELASAVRQINQVIFDTKQAAMGLIDAFPDSVFASLVNMKPDLSHLVDESKDVFKNSESTSALQDFINVTLPGRIVDGYVSIVAAGLHGMNVSNERISDLLVYLNTLDPTKRLQAVTDYVNVLTSFTTQGDFLNKDISAKGVVAQNDLDKQGGVQRLNDFNTEILRMSQGFETLTHPEQVARAQQIAQLTTQRYQTELEYIRQVNDLAKNIHKSIGKQIFDIQQQVRSPQERVDALLELQRQLRDELSHAKTTDAINSIVGEMQSNANELFDLMGRTPEAANQMIDMLNDIDKVSHTQLTQILQDVADSDAAIAGRVNHILDLLETGLKDMFPYPTPPPPDNPNPGPPPDKPYEPIIEDLPKLDTAVLSTRDAVLQFRQSLLPPGSTQTPPRGTGGRRRGAGSGSTVGGGDPYGGGIHIDVTVYPQINLNGSATRFIDEVAAPITRVAVQSSVDAVREMEAARERF